MNYISSRLENFKLDLLDYKKKEIDLIDQYILFGTPYIFKDDESKYYELKNIISRKYEVNTNEVFVVGSSKLGFSIAPKKLWRHFNDESDIDVAIISEKLFDRFWEQLYEFNINLTSRSEREDSNYREFLEYFFKGWIRPDKFPFEFDDKKTWFDFFMGISFGSFDKRKVTCGVFRNGYFFKKYHEINLKNIRNKR